MKLVQNDISLQQLEFPKIIEFLKTLLTTPFSREKVDELTFSSDRDTLKSALEEVQEMMAILETGEHIPLSGFTHFVDRLDKIRPENAFLEPKELLEIKSNLQQMGEVARFFRNLEEEAPRLQVYAKAIHHHQHVIHEIESTIEPSGDLSDNASHELRRIRIEIRSLESNQKKVLKRMQKRYEEYSQDDIITLRDGRMVLGIIPNAINKVNGIVHGTSGSGATVFIEPMETLQISNEIQNLKIQERTEVIRILRFLTGLIREIRNDLFYGVENVALLDMIFAKARFARKIDGKMPKLSEKPVLRIDSGRHPLLILKMGLEEVVPLNMAIGYDFNTIVVTGPNAGGKTVSMKTAGLLILMTQMGMLIPAGDETEIPVHCKILVDIGDRQSLEQDLSTFSAHVLRLKHIVEEADENTLVLLDELGTGTDPKEGAALAIALLKEFAQRKVLTIATTHHGELKVFAHNAEQVENGSMEFDLETLQPTYRLKIGVPGSSYAFEIARRFGLPDSLITAAQEITGSEKDRLEELILALEKRAQEHEREKANLSIKLSQAEAMRRLYERQSADLKANKAALKREAALEAQKVLESANAIIENSVKEIRETGANRETIKHARQLLKEEREKLEDMTAEEREKPVEVPDMSKGDRVRVDTLGEDGELLEDTAGKSKVRVLVGNVKMTLDISSIRPKAGPPPSAPVIRHMSGEQVDSAAESVKPELDLRGMDSQQAVEATNQYLTEARDAGWSEVRIIHGKGTGVLRKAVNQFLSRDKRVAEKRLGKWGEGDSGVTVVVLS